MLSSPIPMPIGNLSSLRILDVSRNQLNGTIPISLGHLSNLEELTISYNFFIFFIFLFLSFENLINLCPLPHISSSSIRYLDLSNNSFNGSLSPLVCEQKDKMRYVQVLDLSKNILSRELLDCWMNYSDLRVLLLGSNKLTGNISSSLGSLFALELLSLNRNNMSGDLPMSLQNCKGLVNVDLNDNHLSDGLSIWLGNSAASLRVLVLRSNRFHGSIPWEFCHLIHFKSWTFLITNYQDPFRNALVI
jgi:Leucine-rich repeat (LRR) protein